MPPQRRTARSGTTARARTAGPRPARDTGAGARGPPPETRTPRESDEALGAGDSAASRNPHASDRSPHVSDPYNLQCLGHCHTINFVSIAILYKQTSV